VGCQQPGEPHEEAPTWQLGASWGGFDTTLMTLDGAERTALRQQAVTVSGTRLLEKGWSLRAALGSTLSGSLGPDLETLPGVQGAVQAGKHWRGADGAKPFVSSSLALAVGWSRLAGLDGASSSAGSLTAADLRLGTAVGWEIGGVWSPYLSAQLFGGPAIIALDGATTLVTDTHHYRLSLGTSFFVGEQLSLFVDLAPLGERGLATGLSYSL
jgi:hypothetical protein